MLAKNQINFIHLDNIIVQVTRKPIKHLILRVDPPDGEVRLSAPHAVSLSDIERYLWSKHAWIRQHCERLQRQPVLPVWDQQAFYACVPDLIAHWQVIMEVQVAAWGIKAMKTRWGSCNPRAKRIWLNRHLIDKPKACLEYVLVHEMVHLLEASHNRRFYALMDHFLPEWRTCQSYLK